jgi:hypothetical protein
MSRALDRARAEVTRAEEDVERWAAAVDAADAEVATAQAADPATPDELDAIGATVVRTQSRAAAARRALVAAGGRLADVRRAALLAEAADEDTAGAAREKDARQHKSKVDALLEQLRALDGVAYEPVTADSTYRDRQAGAFGPTAAVAGRRLDSLVTEAWRHRIRAAVLRGTAATGAVPVFNHELDFKVPGAFSGQPLVGDQIPESARQYVTATHPAGELADVAIG